MKELSIEGKAKRYDEAIEKLRQFYRDYDTVSCLIDVKEELANLFPELTESEDEEVRKVLYEYFKNRKNDGDIDETWYGISYDKILNWLEKQGEQILDNSAKTCKDAQNHAWSEEDWDYYAAIIAKLKVTQDDALLTDNQMEFLKSLKNRVLPQPKQEWSDWDKTIIESIEALCDEKIESVVYQDVKEHVNDIKEWLKDLKERYTWKPSDKQMEVLNWCKPLWNEPKTKAVLESLIDDLKKLREE